MHHDPSSAVTVTPTGLTVTIAGAARHFNAYWLRLACPTTIDPQTRERVFDITHLSCAPRISEATIVGENMEIRWASEDHVTRLSLALLEEVAVNGRTADPAEVPRRLWYAGHYEQFRRFAQTGLDADASERAGLARALIEDGVALVTGMENSDDGLARLVSHLGPVSTTVEGDSFEVRLEIAPTNLAFTANALEMHTDLPTEEWAPGIQFLHCRANTVAGGGSLFVDGAAVAEALRAEDPDAFDLLSQHPIPYRNHHDTWDYRAHQRVIELDSHGAVSGVTVSQHMLDDLDLPQDVLDRYFPALHRFLNLLNEPRFLTRFRLNEGECIVFDNHRIVHGREAFSASSGARHLRGCYTDRGALRSAYRMLVRQGHDGTDITDSASGVA